MKNILFLFLTFMAVVLGCSTAQKTQTGSVTQGITGYITEAVGDQMPKQGAPKQVPRGVLTEVLIYEPTHISQVTRTGTSPYYTFIRTKQIASVQTDSTGRFAVALPIGSYSLFIKQNNGFYSNLFDSNNNIALFTVEENKLTTANLTISLKANY